MDQENNNNKSDYSHPNKDLRLTIREFVTFYERIPEKYDLYDYEKDIRSTFKDFWSSLQRWKNQDTRVKQFFDDSGIEDMYPIDAFNTLERMKLKFNQPNGAYMGLYRLTLLLYWFVYHRSIQDFYLGVKKYDINGVTYYRYARLKKHILHSNE